MRKVALIALIAVLLAAPFAFADNAVSALVGNLGTTLEPANAQSAPAPADDPGMTASEVLPGNGTRAGYMLGHGNVIPGSEWVDVGAKHGTRNRDYTLDNASGTLFFTEPVSQMDSVRVDYRYSTKAAANRSAGSPGLLALRFGSGVQSNMLYAYKAADAAQGFAGQDVLTYGMNTLTKIGGGSSLSSMFYVASPEKSNRMALDTMGAPVAKSDATVKKDHMIVQDADLSAGKVRLKLGYQDVGKDFAGFSSLRDSNAAAADVLNQLEKEKGITRMSVAGEMPSGKDQGLNFGFSNLGDKSGDIVSRSLGYRSSGFAFSYSARDVAKDFSRFKDIREADRGQLAAEAGVSRTNYGMQLRTGFGQDKKSIWSGMNFTELSGDGGSLTYRSTDLDVGKMKVQADVRTMDSTFSRMGALNDEERTRMALMARRQFDPSAPANQVTGDDKAQVNNEQGLDRSTCVVQMDVAQVDTWLSLSSIDSSKGGLIRRAFGVKRGNFSAYFDSQSVDKTFERLGNLQPVERTHYGNESGMTRTELGGKLNVMSSDVTVDTANVVDNIGAGFFREAISLKNPRLSVKANFQDIDPRFSRIMDLSNPDRQTLLQDRGFTRSDYAFNFQATKALNVDTYVYDSTNTTEGQARGQRRYKMAYAPLSGPKVNMLSDDYAYVSESGNLASYSHQEFKFDHTLNMLGGLAVKARNDVYTNQEGTNDPQTTTISENHIESNAKGKTSFSADVVNIDYGNGHFDNTQAVSVKTAAVRSLSLIGGMATTARDSGKSEANGRFGFEWAMRKDLKMTLSMANRNGGPQGGQQTSLFSLNGPLAKRFLFLNDVVVASGTNTTALRGKQTVCDNAFKVDAGMMRGKLTFDNTDKLNPKNGIYYTSRIFQYETDKDPKQPFHLTYFRQNLTTPLGTRAAKRNYSCDFKLASSASMTFSAYEGRDGQNGVVIPVRGTVLKFSRQVGNGTTLIADYTTDDNLESNRHAKVMGFGISRAATEHSTYEMYFGMCDLAEGNDSVRKGVCRAKYDSKINSDSYVTLSFQRKSGVDKSSINPFEGDTVGRVDFKFLFD